MASIKTRYAQQHRSKPLKTNCIQHTWSQTASLPARSGKTAWCTSSGHQPALTWLISSWVVLRDLTMLSSWTRPERRLCSSWASSSCSRLSSPLVRLISSSWLRKSLSWERIWLCSDDIWRVRAKIRRFLFVASLAVSDVFGWSLHVRLQVIKFS